MKYQRSRTSLVLTSNVQGKRLEQTGVNMVGEFSIPEKLSKKKKKGRKWWGHCTRSFLSNRSTITFHSLPEQLFSTVI